MKKNREVIYNCYLKDVYDQNDGRLDKVSDEHLNDIVELVTEGNYDLSDLLDFIDELEKDNDDNLDIYFNAALRMLENNIVSLHNDGYDALQIMSIAESVENGVDVLPYITPEYDPAQIDEIAYGLVFEVDIDEFNDPELSREEMQELREEMCF